jgi:hypothetical protein
MGHLWRSAERLRILTYAEAAPKLGGLSLWLVAKPSGSFATLAAIRGAASLHLLWRKQPPEIP